MPYLKLLPKFLIARNAIFYLLAFLFPLWPKALPGLSILVMLTWVLSARYHKFKKLKNFYSAYLLFSLVFYLIHVVAMTYTENQSYGRFDLEVKLSFLLFPLILITSPRLEKKAGVRVLCAYLLGLGTASILSLILATMNYMETPHIHQFMRGNISPFMHPGYFCYYLAFGMLIVYFMLRKEVFKGSRGMNALLTFGALLFLIMVVLTNSKSGILVMCLLLIVLLVHWILSSKRYLMGAGMAVVFILGLSYVYFKMPSVTLRFQSAFTAVNADDIAPESKESSAVRILAWKSTSTLIERHFWTGTGTGDVRDELRADYAKHGYTHLLKKNLNSHNQYLQTFAAVGVWGFIAIVGMMISLIGHAIARKNGLLMGLTLIFCISALTDSVFEVQAGVLFFNFFACLLLYCFPDKDLAFNFRKK